jgi:aryl-alcohol dehydrogenase-like predicted oxidoreductase
MMRYKKFGKDGISVSEIAIGTWGVGGRGWGGSDKNACISAMNTMIGLGVNLIDTAPVYGDGYAEEVVSEILNGRRDKLIVATKCGININLPRSSNRKISTREEILNGCDASLSRLKTDYIDILFIHWPDLNTPFEETMGAMNTLKKQGKIRYIGLSNFSIQQIEEARKYAEISIIQPPFSMVEQGSRSVIEWAYKHNIKSMTYASLGAGILSGKIRTPTVFCEGDVRNGFYDYFREPKFSKVMELLKIMDKISLKRRVSLSQIAINWVIQKESVLTAIIGERTDEHARENCAAMDWFLDVSEIKELDTKIAMLFDHA